MFQDNAQIVHPRGWAQLKLSVIHKNYNIQKFDIFIGIVSLLDSEFNLESSGIDDVWDRIFYIVWGFKLNYFELCNKLYVISLLLVNINLPFIGVLAVLVGKRLTLL